MMPKLRLARAPLEIWLGSYVTLGQNFWVQCRLLYYPPPPPPPNTVTLGIIEDNSKESRIKNQDGDSADKHEAQKLLTDVPSCPYKDFQL